MEIPLWVAIAGGILAAIGALFLCIIIWILIDSWREAPVPVMPQTEGVMVLYHGLSDRVQRIDNAIAARQKADETLLKRMKDLEDDYNAGFERLYDVKDPYSDPYGRVTLGDLSSIVKGLLDHLHLSAVPPRHGEWSVEGKKKPRPK